jgi:hypothetical protein
MERMWELRALRYSTQSSNLVEVMCVLEQGDEGNVWTLEGGRNTKHNGEPHIFTIHQIL